MYAIHELKLEEVFMPLMGASVLVGLAVALAVKDALGDAVAGIFILADRHFNIGEEIETMKYRGVIIDVNRRWDNSCTAKRKNRFFRVGVA